MYYYNIDSMKYHESDGLITRTSVNMANQMTERYTLHSYGAFKILRSNQF